MTPMMLDNIEAIDGMKSVVVKTAKNPVYKTNLLDVAKMVK